MTDREKAVVMAYTGTVMLTGDKLGIFYDYVSELMGTPLDTIAIAMLAENIKHRATPEFMRICETVEEPRPHGYWISMVFTDTGKPAGYKCSECGLGARKKFHYCHCGAKMDEKEDNT